VSRFAAVDMGTNSTRLLVADSDGGGAAAPLSTVERHMHITRLGQGVNATRRLHPDAVQRTLAVLRKYRDVMDATGVSGVRATATSAARDAANRDDLLGPAAEILGAPVELLSGEDEGRLTFLGATTGLDAPAPHLVVDIGGGSTEFVLGTGVPSAARSVDVGCVRMLERYLHDDPPTREQVAAATASIDEAIASAAAVVPLAQAAAVIGVAGTVTTITAIALDLPEYDPAKIHLARVPAARVREVAQWLLSAPREQRAALAALHPKRVDVIPAGALVLERVLAALGDPDLVACEHDILDGIARSLLGG
jgi:exopolyphosphatase/guanosine-5'-triphosphate,3'-diphosphate pyrophosphatase